MRINRRALAARSVAMVNDGIAPRDAADARFGSIRGTRQVRVGAAAFCARGGRSPPPHLRAADGILEEARRMGGAKRYPSTAPYGDDGFRRLHPSYALDSSLSPAILDRPVKAGDDDFCASGDLPVRQLVDRAVESPLQKYFASPVGQIIATNWR